MKNFWFWLIVVFVFFCAASVTPPAKAQDYVSPNLIGGGYSSITGTTPYSGTGGGTSGGSTPGYNSTTNTIYFGYTQSTVAYTYAFSQALQNSGMTILGYNYAWDYYNQGYSAGNLSATVNFASTTGISLHSRSWTLGTTNGWTNISGTETFTSPGLLASNIANFSLSFNGKDNRFWAGYYGPMVKDPSLTLNYTFDACSSNPLSSPTCPGYAAAYLTQQCTANPLYDPSCPGYAQALLTQQCTANPLSNPQCPGYATAYLNYQCSINPLYSTTCAGYETAYFNQQCEKDGLYSKQCPNYSTAYATKMLLEQQGIASTVATAGVIAQTAPTTTTVDSSSGTVSATPSSTGSTTVDKVITPTTTTANSAAAPAAPVQLVPQQSAQGSPAAPQAGGQQDKQQAEKKDGSSSQGSQQQAQGSLQSNERAGSGGSDQKTARQDIAERRAEAAKTQAAQKGKEAQKEMNNAQNFEQQKAVQGVVIAAMGYSPGFDAYGKLFIPDGSGYKPFTVYNNQKNVDNARVGRGLFGATDRLHNEMVEQQYGR